MLLLGKTQKKHLNLPPMVPDLPPLPTLVRT